jgi:hypothetical protein
MAQHPQQPTALPPQQPPHAPQAWCDPAFSTYGHALGCRMTEWLYADRQSNPYSDDRSKWPTTGRVAFLDRVVLFPSVASAATAISSVNIGGGKNVIIFSRQATVINTSAPAGAPPAYQVLPNEQAGFVDLQIQRQSGFIDVETAPISNNFGFGWAPNIRPVPELWLGNESRQITVTNNGTNSVKIVLTFTLALLDTGR